MVIDYDGYSYKLESGSTVQHKLVRDNQPPLILLDIIDPYGVPQRAALRLPDALELATSLLRDLILAGAPQLLIEGDGAHSDA